MKSLTGRTRHRSAKLGLFGPQVLVLQVEERRLRLNDWPGLPDDLVDTCWRDATVHDFSLLIHSQGGGNG